MGGVSFDFGNRTRAQSIEEYRAKRRFKQVKLGIVVIVWQLVNMLVILSIVEYRNQPQSPVEQSAEIMTFMVVFVSVFCGWPCLLHCMDGFAKTGVVLSVVNGCLAFQTSIILRGLSFILLRGTSKFDIELHDLTEALLATNSFHIASLFLLGRMPPLHLLLASLFFLPGQSLARCLQLEYLYTLDPGSSGPIQLYGTVFGFVSSLILFRGTGSHTSERKNNYIPSSVSLCGSFLLAFSSLIINSLGLPGQQVEFVILNTCLIQSTTITSAAGMLIGSSSLNRKPLDFQLLQGSLIAGGVSAGAVAATKIQPWGAACLGIGTGVLVVLAGTHVEPLISKKLGVPISYYTFSVHGLPALLGGLVAILMASLAEEKQGAIPYGFDLYELYPGRSYPLGQSSPGCEHVNKTKEEIFICPTGTEEISLSLPHLPLLGRSAFDQAAWQAVALALSIGLGTIFGVIGGLVGCFLDRLGGHGMPREAWYDSTCFLETSGFNLSPVLRSNTEDE